MPGKRREHYAGDYDRRAADVRARANADPDTVCRSPTCKGWGTRTLAEHKPGSTWDAGHVRAGDPTSPLQAEVSGCNRGAGASAGNRRRVGIVTTREW